MNTTDQVRFDKLYDQHSRALKRHGKAQKTIEAYGRAVRRLAGFVETCPDDLSTDTLNAFFEWLIDSHGWSTVKLDRNGIRSSTNRSSARATRIASSSCRPSRSRRCGAGGPCTATRAGCSRVRPEPRKCRPCRSWIAVPPSAHSSAPPRTPGSANMCRFIPCATATPPIWWKPASCAPRARQASRGLALDLRGVQDQLGHASPTTTARYVRMTETSALQQDTAINGLVDRLTAAVRAGRGRAG